MAINFDNVPKNSPYILPEKGVYRAKITDAKITANKDPQKPAYLAVTYALMDKQGKVLAKIFDRITESTAAAPLYKLGRLVNAIGLQLTGNVELKDLAKVLPNKMVCVDVTHEADNRDKDNRDKDRAVPRLFGSEVFWPISDANKLTLVEGTSTAAAPTITVGADEVPFATEDDDVAALAAEIADGATEGDDY